MIRILRWILVCFLSSAPVPEDNSYKLVLNSFISGYSGGKRLVYDDLESAKKACNKDDLCNGITREPVRTIHFLVILALSLSLDNISWLRHH